MGGISRHKALKGHKQCLPPSTVTTANSSWESRQEKKEHPYHSQKGAGALARLSVLFEAPGRKARVALLPVAQEYLAGLAALPNKLRR